jgi:hypothetical protein
LQRARVLRTKVAGSDGVDLHPARQAGGDVDTDRLLGDRQH